MRVILNGQQAFGKAALEAILNEGKDDVVAIYIAPDVEGRPFDPVKQCALDHDLPVFQPTDYADAAVLEEMRGIAADLLVMAFVTIFVPKAARDVPRFGSICFHPSLLPLHRGPSSINWPIIAGATKTGLSYFWPDDGLDEGEILLQKEVDIGPDDTLGSVYFDKIFPLGVAATLEAIDLVRSGAPPRISQDESQATYQSWCRKKHVQIDWSQPVATVYNLIRGANPQPGAWTTLAGAEVQIYDCRPEPGAGSAGEIVAIDNDGVVVQAIDGRIRLQRVRPAGMGKITAQEWATNGGVAVGAVLGA